MWLWHGLWGVTINLSLFLLLYVLNKVCGALRSQPSGPPKQEELFNITNVGSSKWTISSELGARDFFLASAGGPPAGCRVSTLPMVANGCRFRLIPFGGLPDGSPAHEGGADAYLDELPWTENSVLVGPQCTSCTFLLRIIIRNAGHREIKHACPSVQPRHLRRHRLFCKFSIGAARMPTTRWSP